MVSIKFTGIDNFKITPSIKTRHTSLVQAVSIKNIHKRHKKTIIFNLQSMLVILMHNIMYSY